MKSGKVLLCGFLLTLIPSVPTLAQVVEGWSQSYPGPGPMSASCEALVLGPDGLVLVSGFERDVRPNGTSNCVSIAYDEQGNELWTYSDEGHGCPRIVDSDGFFFTSQVVPGNAGLDVGAIVTKLNPDRTLAWTTTELAPPGGSLGPMFLASSDGGALVGGIINDSQFSDVDFLGMKFSPTGNLLWSSRWDGPFGPSLNSRDQPEAFTTDAWGNLYITGTSRSTLTGSAPPLVATLKFDASGNLQWSTLRPENVQPAAISADSQGDVFVVGSDFSSGPGGNEMVVIKYDSQGAQEWTSTYPGAGNGQAAGRFVSAYGDGGAVVSGIVSTESDNGDWVVARYDSSGALLWAEQRGGSHSGPQDTPVDMEVDTDGNIYVTGALFNDGPDWTILLSSTVKYSPDGVVQWAIEFDPSTLHARFVRGVEVNSNGEVFHCGSKSSLAGSGPRRKTDLIMNKYNQFHESGRDQGRRRHKPQIGYAESQ